MKFGKKQLLVVSLTLIVCFAVYLNWRFMGDYTEGQVYDDVSSMDDKTLGETLLVDNQNTTVEGNEYFTSAKLNRQKSRDDAIALLKEVAENDKNDTATKAKALEDIRKIASNIEKESIIENLAKAKGFINCIAIIGEGNVSFVVQTQGLKANEITVIKDLCVQESGVKAEKVTIIPVGN